MKRALVSESNHLLNNLLWHLWQPFHFLCQRLLSDPHGYGFRMQPKPPNREDQTPFEHPHSEEIQIHGTLCWSEVFKIPKNLGEDFFPKSLMGSHSFVVMFLTRNWT